MVLIYLGEFVASIGTWSTSRRMKNYEYPLKMLHVSCQSGCLVLRFMTHLFDDTFVKQGKKSNIETPLP
jgi:hypothetical protein